VVHGVTEVLKEDKRDAGGLAEAAVGVLDAIELDELRLGGLLGSHNRSEDFRNKTSGNNSVFGERKPT
jgi:hypothetical protein